ncbi:MAG: universal stress protein [Spirochaetaceae bacterium]|jgi:nucleotide-binding universal stress UspA family protein|nr:universal stress protein [Spirochaetaceae bacterium]
MIKPPISNIVVAISGSGASVHAAKYAIVMAKLYKCRLSAVYVIDSATLRQLTMSRILIADESADFEASLERNGRRYLTFAEELATAKNIRIEQELRRGAVCTEILAVAEEKKADLIILGGWEKDRNAKDVISHLHRELILNAKCSVLIAKEPEIDIMYRHI